MSNLDNNTNIDEAELWTKSFFTGVIPEKNPEAEKNKTNLYGQFEPRVAETAAKTASSESVVNTENNEEQVQVPIVTDIPVGTQRVETVEIVQAPETEVLTENIENQPETEDNISENTENTKTFENSAEISAEPANGEVLTEVELNAENQEVAIEPENSSAPKSADEQSENAENIETTATTESSDTEAVESDLISKEDEDAEYTLIKMPETEENTVESGSSIKRFWDFIDWIYLALVVVLCALLCVFYIKYKNSQNELAKYEGNALVNFTAEGVNEEETEKLQQVYDYILENYYKEVDPNTLIEGAISGMTEALDDEYSTYKSAENMESYNNKSQGVDSDGTKVVNLECYEEAEGIYRIVLKSFSSGIATEFKEALEKCMADGATAIILDLRDNLGGLAIEGVYVADILLGEGTIATVVKRNGDVVTTYESDENELEIPVCLLVNEYTASASELVTAAFKYYNKGEIIGTKTFGKARGQENIQFESDGTGLVLSTCKVLTPGGECIDGVGIEPTIKVENTEEDKDYQLEAAIELFTEADE